MLLLHIILAVEIWLPIIVLTQGIQAEKENSGNLI